MKDSTYGHHQKFNAKIRLIIFFGAKDGEVPYSQKKTRLGADCSSGHEPLTAKLRLKLKKVEKTRLLRNDLNQIPYYSTAEVINRLKGLYLIECLKNYGQRFMTLYRRWHSKLSPRGEQS